MNFFSNEKQLHFSFRKLGVVLCSIALGLFYVNGTNTLTAKADVISQKEATTVEKNSVKENSDKNKVEKITNYIADNKLSTIQPSYQNNQIQNNISNSHLIESKSSTIKYISPTYYEYIPTFKLNQTENQTPEQSSQKSTHINQWINQNNKLYYYDKQGRPITNQWAAPTGTTHYFGREGYTINNQWYTLPDNNTYYFDQTGHTVKNRWYKMSNNNTYYFDKTGHTVKNRWYKMPNNNTYYFDQTGHTVKNRWYKMPDNNTYYFDQTGHTVKNRWYKMPDNNTYYFDQTGHTVKNRWYKMPDNNIYYFDQTGHTVKNGWYTLPNNGTYYFDNTGHTVKNRYYSINGIHYWFDNKGHTHSSSSYFQNVSFQIEQHSDESNQPPTLKLVGALKQKEDIYYIIGNNSQLYAYDTNNFSISDVNGNGGKSITIILKNNGVTLEKNSYVIPTTTISNIRVNNNNSTIQWNNTNGSARVFIKDINGNEKEITDSVNFNPSNSYSYDASEYSGTNLYVELKNKDGAIMSTSPKLTIPKVHFVNQPVLKTDFLSLVVTSSANGPYLAIKDLNTGDESWAGYRQGVYIGGTQINSIDHTQSIDPIEFCNENIVIELKDNKTIGNSVITSIDPKKVPTLATSKPLHIPGIKLTSYYDKNGKKLDANTLLNKYLNPYYLNMYGTRNGNTYVTAVHFNDDHTMWYDTWGINDSRYDGKNFDRVPLLNPGQVTRLVAIPVWGIPASDPSLSSDETVAFIVPNKLLKDVSISNNILTGYNLGSDMDDTISIKIKGENTTLVENVSASQLFGDPFEVDLSKYADRIKNKTLVLTLSRNNPKLPAYEQYLDVKTNKFYYTHENYDYSVHNI